jgi:hypothetical protein
MDYNAMAKQVITDAHNRMREDAMNGHLKGLDFGTAIRESLNWYTGGNRPWHKGILLAAVNIAIRRTRVI